MNNTAHIIITHALIALFLMGCLKACDAEYRNQDAMIERYQKEQYISPSDQMIIDFRNGEQE